MVHVCTKHCMLFVHLEAWLELADYKRKFEGTVVEISKLKKELKQASAHKVARTPWNDICW